MDVILNLYSYPTKNKVFLEHGFGVRRFGNWESTGTRLSEKFLSFYEEIIDAQCFCVVLFSRITYGPFCSVEINTATFRRLVFTFVRRCTVVKDTFAKERHFSDTFTTRFRCGRVREPEERNAMKIFVDLNIFHNCKGIVSYIICHMDAFLSAEYYGAIAHRPVFTCIWFLHQGI